MVEEEGEEEKQQQQHEARVHILQVEIKNKIYIPQEWWERDKEFINILCHDE